MGKAVRRTLYLLAALTLAGVAAVCALTYSDRYGSGDAGRTEQTGGAGRTEQTGDAAASGHPGDIPGESAEEESEDDRSGRPAGVPGETAAEESEDDRSGHPAGIAGEIAEEESEDDLPGRPGEGAGEEDMPREDTTILIAGDVLFGNLFQMNYDKDGITGVVDDALLAELQRADILLINNEFAFSDRGTPMEGKEFTFRCSPSYTAALDEMGVDVVSLANNHSLDYGREALSDTFAALDEAGIRYAGAGESEARAGEVQIFEKNGNRFGILAVSRVVPVVSWKVENQTPGIFSCYDDTRLLSLVEEAKERCDFLVVYPHWGVEYEAYPEEYQTALAKRTLAAGADVVAGCHTHCLQGVEWLEEKPVFYSLGNFVFGKEIDQSAILKITVAADNTVHYELLPVCAKNGVTGLAEEDRAAQILRYLDSISPGAKIEEDGTVTK